METKLNKKHNKENKMEKFRMVKAGEESFLTNEEVKEIMGENEYNFQIHTQSLSWIQDDIEIFFHENN